VFSLHLRLPIPTVAKRKLSEDTSIAKRRRLEQVLKKHPNAGMQVHGVPLEERAFDSKGNRLPWAYEYLEFVYSTPLTFSDND